MRAMCMACSFERQRMLEVEGGHSWGWTSGSVIDPKTGPTWV
jgi:hypothetical protein